jgi:hypothetical protein
MTTRDLRARLVDAAEAAQRRVYAQVTVLSDALQFPHTD